MRPPNRDSSSLFIIHLRKDPLERIVQKALLHHLQAEKNPCDLLKIFYQPAERALIEAVLRFCGKSQTRGAILLGLNRSTLKKKIKLFGIDAEGPDLNRQESFFLKFPVGREIFLSSFSAADLLSACRAKMIFLRREGAFLSPGLLKARCAPAERAIIETAFHVFDRRLIKTAACLGISRNTLKRKLRQSGGGAWQGKEAFCGGAAL